ncbi:hypothetical protein HN588_10600 [Candidatus Bathyarchaeota archaeon]|jgi:hypothetical protein|nr:hypothetical protein [Candidatus Bathyarchaeota archaeon]
MSSDAYTDWLTTQQVTLEGNSRLVVKGPAQTPSRMGDKALKAYIIKCVTEDWMDVEEIPVPAGRKRRNIRRMAKRLGL